MDNAGLFPLQGLFWALAGLIWSSGGQGASSRSKFCGQSRNGFCLFLATPNLCQRLGNVMGELKAKLTPSVPFSIFTATVRHVGDFLMPNADAWTTFPKAPLPSDLPTMKRRRWFVCQASKVSLSLFSGRKGLFPVCVCVACSSEWNLQWTDPKRVRTHFWGIFLSTLYCASALPSSFTARLGP